MNRYNKESTPKQRAASTSMVPKIQSSGCLIRTRSWCLVSGSFTPTNPTLSVNKLEEAELQNPGYKMVHVAGTIPTTLHYSSTYSRSPRPFLAKRRLTSRMGISTSNTWFGSSSAAAAAASPRKQRERPPRVYTVEKTDSTGQAGEECGPNETPFIRVPDLFSSIMASEVAINPLYEKVKPEADARVARYRDRKQVS